MDFIITQNNNLPVVQTLLQNVDDSYIDISAASGVSFIYMPKSRVSQPTTGSCLRLGNSSGFVQFTFPNTTSGGFYYGKFEVNFTGGGKISFPNNQHLLFYIAPNIY
jgi:hypothetical protein